ncbi:hypothetical protein X566_16790 [Afipia sp. P52-10]|nr:hypothetical protein X566_16790 [Afipia sp. P52-10]
MGGSWGVMLRRLSNTLRWRAAWLLSLVYVLATLAPAAANALAISPTSLAHHAGAQAMLAHSEQMSVYARANAKADGHHHHHDQAQVSHQQGHSHGHDHAPAKGHLGDLQCCGLACISALPASLSGVQGPDVPQSIRLALSMAEADGRAPVQLYRPPIS